MRRILIGIFSVLLCTPAFTQTDDPVVMRVNGYDVSKSEFEYFFKKNRTDEPVTKKTLQEYTDLYLNFKLKVQAAIDEGMDKSESFLEEYKTYRDMQAEDYLIDKAFLEQRAKETYERAGMGIGPEGLADISVISCMPGRGAGETEEECLNYLKAVYDRIVAGDDFEALAREYSNDRAAASGGALGWVTRGQIPDDVADIVFSLEPRQCSEPFISNGTAFIVKVNNRREYGTYAQNRSEIYEWMREQDDIYPEAKRRKANEYAARLDWPFRNDTAVAYLDSLLEEVNPDFANISREYHDGLLLFDISSREVWEKASNDIEGMEAYFKSNVKKYKFDEPCFKGMVFFCINEDVFREVEGAVRDLYIDDWIDTLVSYNREKIQVRVMTGSGETGIFKKGQNAYVDKLVFGEGEYDPMPNFPYVNVIGKVLSKPENMNDVIGQVSEDYQNYLEKEWVKSLRKKYKYSINRKALKQVNLDSK